MLITICNINIIINMLVGLVLVELIINIILIIINLIIINIIITIIITIIIKDRVILLRLRIILILRCNNLLNLLQRNHSNNWANLPKRSSLSALKTRTAPMSTTRHINLSSPTHVGCFPVSTRTFRSTPTTSATCPAKQLNRPKLRAVSTAVVATFPSTTVARVLTTALEVSLRVNPLRNEAAVARTERPFKRHHNLLRRSRCCRRMPPTLRSSQ